MPIDKLGSVPTSKPSSGSDRDAQRAGEEVIRSAEALAGGREKVKQGEILSESQKRTLRDYGVRSISLSRYEGQLSTLLRLRPDADVKVNGVPEKKPGGVALHITHYDTKAVEVYSDPQKGECRITIVNVDDSKDVILLRKTPEVGTPAEKMEIKRLQEGHPKYNVFFGGKTADGQLLVVLERRLGDKEKFKGYEQLFSVYLGRPGSMRALQISEADRLRDGGTTTIVTNEGSIYVPARIGAGGTPTFNEFPMREIK